jgi:hypothetical protein
MGDLPPSEFVRALVRAARSEAPPRGAKARALASVGRLATGKLLLAKWIAGSALAVAAGVAAIGWVSSRPTPTVRPDVPSARAPEKTLDTTTNSPAPTGTTEPKRAAEAPSCRSIELADREPSTCSAPGRSEDIAVVNTCGEAVDLFWVDFKCRETFVGRVEPSETFRHHTYDTHPWRARDHATHRLLKEWVGPRQPEAADVPRRLTDVVIRDDSTAKDALPAECSHPSQRADLRFVNARVRGVSVVFWVDYECHEEVRQRLDPGASWEIHTYDAHPWRVRDETGALLVDFVPDGVDDTVYITVP